MSEEEEPGLRQRLGNYLAAFGQSISVRLSRAMVSVQIIFVILTLAAFCAFSISQFVISSAKYNALAGASYNNEFWKLGAEVNMLVQERLSRYEQIVDAMAETFPDVLPNVLSFALSAPNYVQAATLDWSTSSVYSPYGMSPFSGSTLNLLQELSYYDSIMPHLVPTDIRATIKRVEIMFAKNGTSNNIPANFIKFWPNGPYSGRPAEVVSSANYNYFANANTKSGDTVYISPPYLDFKDGSK
jgi:hypothetical protein